MSDIVERLKYEPCSEGLQQEALDVIESLSQQLAHAEMAAEAEAKFADGLRQQLAECQAREKVLRDALSAEDEDAWILKETALSMPSNSTALDEALKRAK